MQNFDFFNTSRANARAICLVFFNFAPLLFNKAAYTAGAGALSSLQRATVDGHGPPGPVASIPARFGVDPVISSPELGEQTESSGNFYSSFPFCLCPARSLLAWL